ncbi:MAG: ribonuclease P protein component [Wolbachia endosymbiont of Fragariocoptes setiger]|nr:ribonuclease P protein component [Wolbachia endosymbiont of Fragariocoptes setiger]
MHNKLKKKDFSYIFKKKLIFNSPVYHSLYTSLYAIAETKTSKCCNKIRLGIGVNKKAGKANKRNKIKRQLRSIAKETIPYNHNIDYYYVILTRKKIIEARYQDLKKDLTICLKKIVQKIH